MGRIDNKIRQYTRPSRADVPDLADDGKPTVGLGEARALVSLAQAPSTEAGERLSPIERLLRDPSAFEGGITGAAFKTVYRGYSMALQADALATRAVKPLHVVESLQVMKAPLVLTSAISTDARGKPIDLEPGTSVLCVRSLRFDGAPARVLIDASTGRTYLVDGAVLDGASRAAIDADAAESWRFARALGERSHAPLTDLARPGGADGERAISITIDLCPTHREWTQSLWDDLVELAAKTGRPVPVGIAITEKWVNQHPLRFRQLLEWQSKDLLAITWVNHSAHHPLSRDGNGELRFLTDPAVDLTTEVAGVETMLLEQGQLFSSLFRFPGLVHDENRRSQLSAMGLLTLDANRWWTGDDWLADGSLVLLHGNGNNVGPVRQFQRALMQQNRDVLQGRLRLVSPLEAIPFGSTSAAGEARSQ